MLLRPGHLSMPSLLQAGRVCRFLDRVSPRPDNSTEGTCVLGRRLCWLRQVWWGGASGIEIDIPLMIDAAFAAGSAMIAFGAVLGKATPTQMLWLTFIMIPIYAVRTLQGEVVAQV